MVASVAIATLAGTTGAASGATGTSTREVPPRLLGLADPLDLGPAGLPETRTTTAVQPGVTLTRITRGAADRSLFWTLEALIPSTASSPDPDAPPRVLSDLESAQAQAARLRAKGFSPRVEPVNQPAVADVPAGILGYRVRVGSFPDQAAADQAKAELAASGEPANSVYTGWDGDPDAGGPWHVNVIRIDPRTFSGTLRGSFGPDLFNRETTSTLSAASGATVGINGGYFVLDPASGAPGDPAGTGVYEGTLLSEPTNDRPALILHGNARRHSRQPAHLARRRRHPRTCPATRRDQPGADPDQELWWRQHRSAHRPPASRHHVHRRRRAGRVHARVRRKHARRSRPRTGARRSPRRPRRTRVAWHPPPDALDIAPGHRDVRRRTGPREASAASFP